MDYSLKKQEKLPTIKTSTTHNSSNHSTKKTINESCKSSCCFFCIMKEPDLSIRRAGIAQCFKEIHCKGDAANVLVLSGLWNIAMSHPDDPEFPSLGLFDCVSSLIHKAVSNHEWLVHDQNIYIPYYAAHIIGSYTMNKVEFSEKAVESGVIPPLLDLLRGKISWVEQRVAVRALGHLASYPTTFEAVAAYEEQIVTLSMELAATCLHEVYKNFVGLAKRLKYHCDLLTRGIGGVEMENKKAEEWASQLQCWSIYLLNCFAIKQRSLSLNLICNNQEFLFELSQMWGWGGLLRSNNTTSSSPGGVGLIRILCYTKKGRKAISESKQVLESLCNLSRSSDEWQYMGIDCLLLLLKDSDTRYDVMEIVTHVLLDLVDLKTLGDRSNLGQTITKLLLLDYEQRKVKIKSNKVQKALEELWVLNVERTKREKLMPVGRLEDLRVLTSLTKQQGDHMFWLGNVEGATNYYSEALEICPLKLRKERLMLYSNRAQCYLILREPDAAISDSTRALCLSNPVNSRNKSLWRRSQAYDMKGLAKESLMDCIMYINGCIKSETSSTSTKRLKKIPYSAARMISKQMDATWIFARAKSKMTVINSIQESGGGDNKESDIYNELMSMIMEKNGYLSGLSTIIEEPFILKEESKRKIDRIGRRKQEVVARSM